jgi:secondary thiamine-phosphate synthase enzyme
MKVFFKDVSIDTRSRKELVDITSKVEEAVRESGVVDGTCLVYSVHTTSAVIVNENEEGLLQDIVRKVTTDFRQQDGWLHDRVDDNADAHLAGVALGPAVTLPVRGRSLGLGRWQSVFFFELDGPRSGRKIILEVMGE